MSEFDIYRVLAQKNPTGTTVTTAYTKPSKQIVTVYQIIVANVDSSAHAYSVYICTNGTTYDSTTAIAEAIPIAANESQCIELAVSLDTTSGTIGVKSSSANNINFTIIGKIREYN